MARIVPNHSAFRKRNKLDKFYPLFFDESVTARLSTFTALVVPLLAFAQHAPPSKPFERFDGCALEPDEWTDGDSFRVRLPDGRLETFRLYFVDTTESRSRGKRSDEQAAYFGLTRAQAIELGRQAKVFTASAPCTTVHDLHTLAESLWTNSLLKYAKRNSIRHAGNMRNAVHGWGERMFIIRPKSQALSTVPSREQLSQTCVARRFARDNEYAGHMLRQ